MQLEVLNCINIVGVLAFAFVGAMRAIDENMDILGIFMLGIITALGGGILRDLLVNKIPYALSSISDMTTALIGVFAAILFVKKIHKDISRTMYILIPDALGLAAFTSTGAIIAYDAKLSVFGVIILAAMTAVGGGVLGDIFCGKIPFILKGDFYATCAIIGACLFYISNVYKIDPTIGSLFCIGIVFTMRIMAIYYQWHLPKINYLQYKK